MKEGLNHLIVSDTNRGRGFSVDILHHPVRFKRVHRNKTKTLNPVISIYLLVNALDAFSCGELLNGREEREGGPNTCGDRNPLGNRLPRGGFPGGGLV